MSAWKYPVGIGLCVGASHLNQMANILLKLEDNENDKREANDEEPMESCNTYKMWWGITLGIGTAMDAGAMTIIPTALWACLCTMDIIIYQVLAAFFIDDPFEYNEMFMCLIVAAGIFCQTFGGPGDEEFDKSALLVAADNMEDRFGVTIMAFVVTALVFGVCFYFVHKRYVYIKANTPGEFPESYMPNPLSIYNIGGIICSSASTCLLQTCSVLLTKSLIEIHWTVVIPLFLLLPFGYLHFHWLFFMQQELHVVSATIGQIIGTSLFHVMWSNTMWNPNYRDSTLYFIGVAISVASFAIVMWVEEVDWEPEAVELPEDEEECAKVVEKVIEKNTKEVISPESIDLKDSPEMVNLQDLK